MILDKPCLVSSCGTEQPTRIPTMLEVDGSLIARLPIVLEQLDSIHTDTMALSGVYWFCLKYNTIHSDQLELFYSHWEHPSSTKKCYHT